MHTSSRVVPGVRSRLVVGGLIALVGAGCHAAASRPADRSGARSAVAEAGSPVVTPADIDRLVGVAWVGTLTYKDYTSGKPTAIRSTLRVTPLPSARPHAWTMAIGYPDEPHADSTEPLTLSDDGTRFDDNAVVARAALGDGRVRITTEQEGSDNGAPARLRRVYTFGADECSVQLMVRPAGQPEFFERHIYVWRRADAR